MNKLFIEGTNILFKNFKGAEQTYVDKRTGREKISNAKGKRYFNLIIPEELAIPMSQDGWKVKEYVDNNGETIYHVKINVNFDCKWPPEVLWIKPDGRHVTMSERTIDKLDGFRFKWVDVEVNPYTYFDDDNNECRSGYLTSMAFELDDDMGGENRFANKYRDYLMGDSDEDYED